MEEKTNILLDEYRIISTKYSLGLIKENECGKLLKQTLIGLKKEIKGDIKQLINNPSINKSIKEKSGRKVVFSKKLLEIFYIIYKDRMQPEHKVSGLGDLDEEIQDKINRLLKKINN